MALAGFQLELRISKTPFTKKSDGTLLNKFDNIDRSQERQELETTGFNDDSKTTVMAGKEFTMSVSGTYAPMDAGQAILFDCDDKDEYFYIGVWEDKTQAVGKQYKVFCKSIKFKAERNGKQGVDIEFSVTEKPTVIGATV